MRPVAFPLDASDRDGPRFLAIARSVSDAIASGRLKPGDALPGSRELAESAGVNRNTVLAALHELRLEGWIETSGARGTFVSRELPTLRARAITPRAHRRASELAFDLRGATPSELGKRHHGITFPRAAFPLLGGIPDLRALPHAEIARSFRRALAR